MLNRFILKIVFSPTNKVYFSNLKNLIEDHNNCGKNFLRMLFLNIGQTKRTLRIRLKEHQIYVIKQELEKFTIAKH